MSLLRLAKSCKNILKPFGHTDVLLFYAIAAKQLERWLKGKEIAAKIWIPSGPQVLKRGTKLEPLYIEEFDVVDEEFLKIRAEKNLADVKQKLNKTQIKIWEYFPPRKLADLFYATNREGAGKPIDRIFYDIDRSNLPSEIAQKVTAAFLQTIQSDEEFNKLVDYRPFLMWTGHSFHVYLMLKKPITPQFYNQHIHFSKNEPMASFTGRWAEKLKKELGINIGGGHEKVQNRITLDPSQTPSGKLARAPFSLHMADARTVDGVAIPLTADMLKNPGLVKRLQSYRPEDVVKEIEELAKRI
ncbi:MAG: hypothetical protein QXP39_01785 [Candidatus Aenigmatarchaeota archaeon]